MKMDRRIEEKRSRILDQTSVEAAATGGPGPLTGERSPAVGNNGTTSAPEKGNSYKNEYDDNSFLVVRRKLNNKDKKLYSQCKMEGKSEETISTLLEARRAENVVRRGHLSKSSMSKIGNRNTKLIKPGHLFIGGSTCPK